ncbi:hypothetical protein FRC12_018362 [Ceratobasidium sp. 428]|nr:hypothetical protein FRC12_018362 [Ceratobasidium sp. 428]
MQNHHFTRPEREFLLDSLDEWAELRGSGRICDQHGDLFSPKDVFVDGMVARLLEAFPERDKSRKPNSSSAFTQLQRDKLHTRVKQLFYNESREKEDGSCASKSSLHKLISVPILFKQRYTDRIRVRRDTIAPGQVGVALLNAYNQAVKEEMAALRREDPAAYEELESLVESMRSAKRLPYEDQDPDVQEALLDVFPGSIVSTLKNWERTTGARVYVMAVTCGPSGQPSGFDYATRNCGKFLKSTSCAEMQKTWQDYVGEEFGSILTQDATQAKPAVWLNHSDWPMYPDV